jgi:hypothetical protein
VEGAKQLVVLQIERPRSLKVALEGGNVRRLYDELLGCSHLTELLLALGCREPGRPPRSAAMMGMGVGIEMRRVVLLAVGEEL